MKKMNKKGFTIVELVIVIAVIAILAAVLIPTFSGVVDKANASAALQTAKSTLTNALSMSSTAQLPKDTKIVVDGYAYNYTGNQIEACDYPTSSTSITLGQGTNEFNAIIISADSLQGFAKTSVTATPVVALVSATNYDAAITISQHEGVMTIKNGAAKVIAENTDDNKLGCLGEDITVAVTCVQTTSNSTTSTHYYVNYETLTKDSTDATVLAKYKAFTGDTEATKVPEATVVWDAEIYVNSDLDKDVVVFTNFGK